VPAKEVKAGDKWETSVSQSSNGANMVTTNNLTLKKINGGVAEISGSSTIEPDKGSPSSMDLRGLGKSSLTIDTKSGLVVKGSTQTHTQGSANGVPIEMDSTTELTVVQ
jgi:hypothetical protein